MPVARIQHVPHLFRIVLPIRGEVQAAIRRQLAHQQRGERGIHQPPLVVALLVPGIGEVDADLVQRSIGDFVFQHFHRIVVVEPGVAGIVVASAWVALRGEAEGLAVAEADLEDALRLAPERGVEIARRACVIQPEARPQRIECALLRLGEAALAQHEAAHLALARR
jgi:hypothetical protein